MSTAPSESETPYQGFSNRETWKAYQHLTGHRDACARTHQQTAQAWEDSKRLNHIYTRKETAVLKLAATLEKRFQEESDASDLQGWKKGTADAGLALVNWQELAEALLSGFEEAEYAEDPRDDLIPTLSKGTETQAQEIADAVVNLTSLATPDAVVTAHQPINAYNDGYADFKWQGRIVARYHSGTQALNVFRLPADEKGLDVLRALLTRVYPSV